MLYEIARYFIVSGFEYYAMLCLTYAFFRLKPWQHTKEILFTVFTLNIATIFSIFVIKSDFYFSTFLIVIAIVALSFYIIFKKWNYVFLSVVGLGIYIVLQTFVLSLSMMLDHLMIEDIFAMSEQGELMQLTTSVAAVLIAFVIQINNSGFSYQVDSKASKALSIVVASMCPVSVICIYKLVSTNTVSNEDFLLMFFTIGITAFLVIMMFSKIKENKEYSIY